MGSPEDLIALVDEMLDALKPFAEAAGMLRDNPGDIMPLACLTFHSPYKGNIFATVGDFRRAAEAYARAEAALSAV